MICFKNCVLVGCFVLTVERSADIEKVLKTVGYSEGAIKEILKWYEQSHADRRT
jgi:hypothetical protein